MKKIFFNNRYILKYMFKSCPLYIPLNLINSAINSLVSILNLVFLKFIVDTIASHNNFNNLLAIILIYSSILIIAMLINTWFMNCYNPQSILKVQKYMQNVMFNKTKTLELCCYDDADFYDRYVKAMYEIDGRVQNVSDTIIGMFGNIISISGIASIMFILDPIFIVFALLGVLSSVFVSFRINKLQYNFSQKRVVYERRRDYIKRTFYLQQFAKELRLFYFSGTLKNIFNKSTQYILQLLKDLSLKNFKLNITGSLGRISINTIMMLYLCWQIINEKLSIGDFLALFNSVTYLSASLTQLISAIPQLYQHSLYIDNLKEFIDYKSIIEENEDGYVINTGTVPDIEIKNISFLYPNQKDNILKGINIKIKRGQKIAFVGHNGSGKSTLIKLILRLYDPSDGNIILNNRNYKEINTKSLRDNFGVVLQDFQSYAVTIGENVLMRSFESEEDEHMIWKALELSGLSNKVKAMPKGINSLLTKEFTNDGVMLSCGEMQKLALARVFAKECGIVILDEPSSSLDPISENEMFENMINGAKDKTVIIVSHRLSVTRKADIIYLMDDGRIIEQGTHDYLMSIEGKYKRMFNIQAEKYID